MSDSNLSRHSAAPTEAAFGHSDDRSRRLNQVLVDLAKHPLVHSGSLGDALREISETAARSLELERVSVWFFTEDRSAIRSADVYEQSVHRHTSGSEIIAASYPAYFRSLESERTMAASDAFRDPRTAPFTDTYLGPLGISSLLDAPIRHLGQIVGVVCHEQVGPIRVWNAEEESFASSIGDLVSMALDAAERVKAQKSLQHRLEFEQLIASISTFFINIDSDKIDAGIEEALQAIVRFVDADRGHVVLMSDDRVTGTMTHEWVREGVAEARQNEIREVPIAAFPWTHQELSAFRALEIPSLDDFPPEAARERELHERYGTRALVAVPMVAHRTLFGFLGVNSVREGVRFPKETATLLRIAGEIFLSAIQRCRNERAIRESEERHRLLFERNLAGVYRNTVDGRILECNDSLARMLGFSSREELMACQASDLYFSLEDRHRFLAEIMTNGSATSVEVCMKRQDGTPVWLIESVHLLKRDGEPDIIEGTMLDISDRKLVEIALRDSEARYRLMAENSTDMISRNSFEGVFLYASDASRRLMGFEPSELVGRKVLDFILEPDRNEVLELSRLLEIGPITISYRVQRKDGEIVWFETTSRAVRRPDSRIEEIVSVSRDISERRRAEEQIEYQAYHDSLTELPNRLLFRDRLTVALAHARRLRETLAVMFLDLDGFKLVNDTLGHSVGDELLKAIGGRLQRALREEDSIARMGGDEFTILLSDLRNSDDAAGVAQKLLDTIAEPIEVEGHELFITTSIGIAVFPADGDTSETLLQNADNAMYRAKEGGRNSYQLCTPAMNRRAFERLGLENAIRRGIDRGEFILYYQPQISLSTGEIIGAEALLRWNHPQQGLVSPATFIPVAEETRLIVPLGEWAVREACRQAREWRETRFPVMRMAVNLSPRQFQATDLRKVIASALSFSGLDPRSLEVEITESTAMQNTDRTVATLRGLRDMGVSIAIDDFGTGHSSLNYLRSFPIDCVKVDQAFVHEIDSSASDRAIVSAIITMAKGLELRVIAEGVETLPQMQFLKAQGCEEVQGYLFGRPVPPEQFTATKCDV